MQPQRDARVIEERATRVWLAADGIVRAQIRQGMSFTLDDSVAALAATRALARAIPAPVLVDCRGVRAASYDSRHFWESGAARGSLSAMAILVGSPVSRMIATFFVRLVRPDFRLRVFSSEDEAARWLSEPST